MNYIGEKGYIHLDELTIATSFHPTDVEEILYNLVLTYDERTNSEKNKIANFIMKRVKSNKLDLTTDPNWMTESIYDFAKEFETDENKA